MGCCQSRLLGLEDNQAKYEAGPIEISQQFRKNITMAKIGIDQMGVKQDRSSLCTLRSNLQQALKSFQKQKGPITYTFLTHQTPNSQVLPSPHPIPHPPPQKSPLDSNLSPSQQNSLTLEQSSQSLHIQSNANILSNTSIQTRRQLEKQLFYINSSQIGAIKLFKWTEDGRVSFQGDAGMGIGGGERVGLDFVGALEAIFQYERKNKISLIVYKALRDHYGFRIFLNGTKRMLKIPMESPQPQPLLHHLQKLPQILPFITNNISFWIYVLTGWIPQIINISNFQNTKEILRKLVKNFMYANLMVTFTATDRSEVLVAKAIDGECEEIGVVVIGGKEGIDGKGKEGKICWKDVLEGYSHIHVNWNPMIYGFAKKIQAVGSLDIPQMIGTKPTTPKFRLKIPSSKSQVQVRILAQIHQCPLLKITQFELLLYQSNSKYLNFQQQNIPIRTTVSANPFFLSEIFMFQQCQEASQYILAVRVTGYEMLGDWGVGDREFQVTLDLYTFCQLKAQPINQPQLLNTKCITSQMQPKNAGFGMNSPLFTNNLQYTLLTKSNTVCQLKIKTHAPTPVLFEICVLPDYHNYQDLTLIKPEELVRDVIQSDQFQGQALFQFKPKTQRSIVVVVCFTPVQAKFTITCQQYSIDTKYQTPAESILQFEQLHQKIQYWRQFSFWWQQQSPGPRKRTVTNSQKIFYPITAFQNFFKNPFIDYFLPQANYQFCITSKNFTNNLIPPSSTQNQQEYCMKVLNAVPPSLSMAIFQLNGSYSEVKIVLDDCQYVPYGIGFWTGKLRLSGLYRFVFSKIQKELEEGIFRIRKFDG